MKEDESREFFDWLENQNNSGDYPMGFDPELYDM